MVSRAWNGCGVKWKGYRPFWSRSACSVPGLKAYWVQSSSGCPDPALNHALFAYAHVAESAAALDRAPAMVGLMSDSFCVNPDQAADSATDGPQLEDAAFTPHPAARSRSRSALSEGFCCSAIRSRSLSCQVGV